jgi:hypothetical protein
MVLLHGMEWPNRLKVVFTMNIYIKKYKPEATQKQIINIAGW